LHARGCADRLASMPRTGRVSVADTWYRYVERNALRAELVERAEDWEWSSLPDVPFSSFKGRGQGKKSQRKRLGYNPRPCSHRNETPLTVDEQLNAIIIEGLEAEERRPLLRSRAFLKDCNASIQSEAKGPLI
jgi:hypothetical protein